MQHMQKMYQAYAMATQTVAGTRQIVMLYDGIIRSLKQAEEAMRDNRIEDRYHALVKASEIITGLQGCLDFERGEHIAGVLYGFYASMDLRIFSLHRTNDVAECEQIIAEIRQMRDLWDEIDRTTPQGETPVASSAPAQAENSGEAALGNLTLSA